MKQSIFDLLDDYEEESINIEETAPLSAERIRALTLQRLPQRRRRARMLRRTLIAAAALAVLSVTALAVTGAIGAADRFRDFFGLLSDGQRSAIDPMSRQLEGVVAADGASLTPLAVLVDENVCYLRLRVEAPEGTTLGALPEGYSYKLYGGEAGEQLRYEPVDRRPYLRKAAVEGGEITAYGFGFGVAEFDLPDDDPTDNAVETILRITADQAMAEHGLRFNDGIAKRLSVGGLWIMSPEIDFAPVFRADFTLEIDSRFESRALPLECGSAAWTDGRGVTYTLDAALLSPLSLSFHYVSDLPMPAPPHAPDENANITPADLPQPNAFALVLRDGTRIDCGECETGSGNTGFSINELDWQPYWSLWDCVLFDAPIDPSQVDHVEYGGCLLPLRNE